MESQPTTAGEGDDGAEVRTDGYGIPGKCALVYDLKPGRRDSDGMGKS